MFGYQEFIKGNQHRRKAKAQEKRARALEKHHGKVAAGMGLATGATSALVAKKLLEKKEAKTGKSASKLKKAAIIGGAAVLGGAAGTAAGHYGAKELVKHQREAARKNRKLARKMYLKGTGKLALHGAATAAAIHTLAPGAMTAAGAKALALGKAGIHALGPHAAALYHWGAAHAVPAAKVAAGGAGLYYVNKKIDKA